mmetsp:Transcript_19565/g.65719  ORF Transcript_19565/g.65719 Transcript_19565/m.65719 type:complete len:405 (+) Transcript_19565:206-1420(+)
MAGDGGLLLPQHGRALVLPEPARLVGPLRGALAPGARVLHRARGVWGSHVCGARAAARDARRVVPALRRAHHPGLRHPHGRLLRAAPRALGGHHPRVLRHGGPGLLPHGGALVQPSLAVARQCADHEPQRGQRRGGGTQHLRPHGYPPGPLWPPRRRAEHAGPGKPRVPPVQLGAHRSSHPGVLRAGPRAAAGARLARGPEPGRGGEGRGRRGGVLRAGLGPGAGSVPVPAPVLCHDAPAVAGPRVRGRAHRVVRRARHVVLLARHHRGLQRRGLCGESHRQPAPGRSGAVLEGMRAPHRLPRGLCDADRARAARVGDLRVVHGRPRRSGGRRAVQRPPRHAHHVPRAAVRAGPREGRGRGLHGALPLPRDHRGLPLGLRGGQVRAFLSGLRDLTGPVRAHGPH